MLTVEFYIVTVLKALTEIALMALIAQGLVGLISGNARQQNFVYRLFQVITQPAIKLTRALTPAFIANQHLGLVSFFLWFWVWLGLIYAKRALCLAHNLACFGS